MTRPTLLTILGMVRSGSTYLEGQLADLHGGVAVGELVGAWGAFTRTDLLCSCGATSNDCGFWKSVRARYPGLDDAAVVKHMTAINRALMPVRHLPRWRPVMRDRLHPGLERYRLEARALIAAVADVGAEGGHRVVVDSSKHPVFYALAHRDPHPGFDGQTCVRMVRDPRGVIFSLQRPKVERTTGEDFAMKGYGAARALGFWVAMNEAADRVAPPDAVRLRYEDLDRGPGLLEEVLVPAPRGATSARHQLVANPVRQGGPTMFRFDDRWRNQLNRPQQVALGMGAWPWMRRYGYRL